MDMGERLWLHTATGRRQNVRSGDWSNFHTRNGDKIARLLPCRQLMMNPGGVGGHDEDLREGTQIVKRGEIDGDS